MKKETAEQIAQSFIAMGHSVELINGIINGTKMIFEKSEDKEATLKRNIEHLETMLVKEYWTNENMTAVKKAIDDGKKYLA